MFVSEGRCKNKNDSLLFWNRFPFSVAPPQWAERLIWSMVQLDIYLLGCILLVATYRPPPPPRNEIQQIWLDINSGWKKKLGLRTYPPKLSTQNKITPYFVRYKFKLKFFFYGPLTHPSTHPKHLKTLLGTNKLMRCDTMPISILVEG